jgi:hypothetical protein
VIDGSPHVRVAGRLSVERELDAPPSEVLNAKAVSATNRVRQKLTGRDFSTPEPLDINEQVDRLIRQATAHEHLCQMYIGWCVYVGWLVVMVVAEAALQVSVLVREAKECWGKSGVTVCVSG